MSKKKIIYALCSAAIGLAVALIFLEIVFRFLPVSSSLLSITVDGISKATPNRDLVYSVRWNFRHVAPYHVNNAGFVNDQDYFADHSKPMIAVVGDSYIEAFVVQPNRAYFELLQEELKDRFAVYSFGFSGAPLSQYLIWAKHAREVYKSNYLIITVIGNDFDESLLKYKSSPGYAYYDITPDGLTLLPIVEPKKFFLHNFLARSSFLSYLKHVLQINTVFNSTSTPKETQSKPLRYAANKEYYASDEKIALSKLAVDAFLRDLPEYAGLPADRVLFVLDGIRGDELGDLYSENPAFDSYAAQMFAYLRSQAGSLGYEVIDMQNYFSDDYIKNGARFEYEDDGHWNEYGHQIVFETIIKNPAFLANINAIENEK
ncbi:hypothetical protein AGMMS50229_07860 [Campylobacterota bacterium]|nr:hypothetical protein AGMMS50229_07860 [Campylobacterota bacterium]